MAAFKRSGYSSADVEQAKKKFDFLKGASTQEVKEYMGLKVLNDYTSMMTEKGITAGSRSRTRFPESSVDFSRDERCESVLN